MICIIGCTKNNIITGTWYWKSPSSNSDTTLYLTQNGNTITGKHCSSFISGSKLDCIENDADDSMILNLVAENVYEGTLKSGSYQADISIRITLNPDNETLYLEQLSQPNEEFYLPNKATFSLTQP